ncbi:MAG: sugar phosphate nucleotidyltransferase [Pseudomonadota bacterium]
MSDHTRIRPVIMCGGSGTRLWPLSTPEKPKQFHALVGETSMFEDTLRRFETSADETIAFEAPLVVAGLSHKASIAAEIENGALGVAETIFEPAPRNTAPVAAAAAIAAQALGEQSLVLLTPADHYIARPDAFHAAIARATPAAHAGRIVTFGLRPDHPATGYGYIRQGAPYEGIYDVDAFVEKPDEKTAAAYIADGRYAWNAGVFLFSPKALLAEMADLCPDILNAAKAAYTASVTQGGARYLDAAAFAACPSDSIDYAVMEKTEQAAVAPADIGWSDVGSFEALRRLGNQDADGNVVKGDASATGSKRCYVATTGPKVAVLGLEDIVVVATEDGVVVAPAGAPEAVGDFAKTLLKK